MFRFFTKLWLIMAEYGYKLTAPTTLSITTLRMKTLSLKTLSLKTLGLKTLSLKTLSIKTLSITSVSMMTHSLTIKKCDTVHNDIEQNDIRYCYAECCLCWMSQILLLPTYLMDFHIFIESKKNTDFHFQVLFLNVRWNVWITKN